MFKVQVFNNFLSNCHTLRLVSLHMFSYVAFLCTLRSSLVIRTHFHFTFYTRCVLCLFRQTVRIADARRTSQYDVLRTVTVHQCRSTWCVNWLWTDTNDRFSRLQWFRVNKDSYVHFVVVWVSTHSFLRLDRNNLVHVFRYFHTSSRFCRHCYWTDSCSVFVLFTDCKQDDVFWFEDNSFLVLLTVIFLVNSRT